MCVSSATSSCLCFGCSFQRLVVQGYRVLLSCPFFFLLCYTWTPLFMFTLLLDLLTPVFCNQILSICSPLFYLHVNKATVYAYAYIRFCVWKCFLISTSVPLISTWLYSTGGVFPRYVVSVVIVLYCPSSRTRQLHLVLVSCKFILSLLFVFVL